MTEKEDPPTESGSESEADESPEMTLQDIDIDSDEELQEAFAAGLIQPGLNTVYEKKAARPRINNTVGLNQKLAELEFKAPWIERLDLVNKLAPLAPELALQEDQHLKAREKVLKQAKVTAGIEKDAVHNDFKRELLFYRQAQAAVLEAIPRLKSMGIKTKRPEDYFAQMAKTDEHMQKIREKIVSKQLTEERMDKIRKLRELKKFGKKVQIEVQQKRQKEKSDMLNQVKKFRKGQTDSIDFLKDLEDEGSKKKGGKKAPGGGSAGPMNNKRMLEKRKVKDKKFGFGGKKKGSKANTKDSVNDVSGFKRFKKPAAGGMKGGAKRLGKARRKVARNKKK